MGSANLPPNWSWVKLGDVAKIKGGKRLPKGKTYSSRKTNCPYLRVVDFNNMSIDESDIRYLERDTQEQIKSYTISSKDLYISIAGSIGKVGRIPTNLDGSNLTENAAKITEINNFDLDYVKFYLNSQSAQVQIKENTIATTQPKLALFRIEKILIPLPPLTEQKKIVEKIEELFSGLDSGVASLKKAKEQIKLYRQSVLAYAFSGRLCKNLINQIPTENNLPEGWKWVKLGEIANVKGGKRLPKGESYAEAQTNFPYIRVIDFENMTVRMNELRYLKSETRERIKNYFINKSDLYISIAGTIGRVGLIPDQLDGANLTENAAKITEIKKYDLKFLAYLMNSYLVQNQIKTLTISTTQPKLALFRIEKLDLIQPPLHQQTQIVEEIEKRFSEADNLEKAIDESLEKAEALRQSILKQAFEGRLV